MIGSAFLRCPLSQYEELNFAVILLIATWPQSFDYHFPKKLTYQEEVN